MAIKRKLENRNNSNLEFQVGEHKIHKPTQNKELYQPSTLDFFSLLWFKQGEGQYYIDFNKYTFKPNTIVIISKDQVHYFEPQKSPFEFIELSFTEDFASRSSHEILQMLSFCIREHFEGKQILEITINDSEYLHIIVQQMQRVYSAWIGKEQSESLFYLLQLFLVYCHKLQNDHIKAQHSNATGNYVEMVGNFTSLLERNFKTSQKVNDYCDQLYLSYNTLAKYTKSYCGKSPKEIIAERVTLEAKRMLSSSDMPVKEIAYALGFDEPTNMVKFFKKRAGYTPTVFREMQAST